ncbi:hypothetical protein STEG23_037905 [Scotinomys teguina]
MFEWFSKDSFGHHHIYKIDKEGIESVTVSALMAFEQYCEIKNMCQKPYHKLTIYHKCNKLSAIGYHSSIIGEQLSIICTAKFGFEVVQYASILFGIIVNNKFRSKSEIDPLSFKSWSQNAKLPLRQDNELMRKTFFKAINNTIIQSQPSTHYLERQAAQPSQCDL